MSITKKKNDHISLASKSQIEKNNIDDRFNYEPLLSSHINSVDNYRFLGQRIGAPIFISSITGGSHKSIKINRIISKVAKEYNLPMGLGSIRPYLDNLNLKSYAIRKYAGDDILLFGNIGICQIEQLLKRNEIYKLDKAINNLELDGLIIHINPLQEFLQPNGDILFEAPLNTLKTVIPELKTKIIVKEVGAGFGPKSLSELLNLSVDVIDFAAFGGTNFSLLELTRNKKNFRNNLKPLVNIGHTPENMINNINELLKNNDLDMQFIISGGIKNFLDGYYYMSKLNGKSIYGYANNILQHALISEKSLFKFIEHEIYGLSFASNYLSIR